MKKYRTSAVWKYFNDGPDKGEVTCLLCNVVLKSYRSTTSQARHLKSRHPGEINLRDFSVQVRVKPTPTNHSPSPSKSKVQKFELEPEPEDATQKLLTNSSSDSEGEDTQDPIHTNNNNDESNSQFKSGKSRIWKYFLHSKPGKREAKCILCASIIQHHGRTTNLVRHLRAKHVAEAQLINKKAPLVPVPPLPIGNNGLNFNAASTSQSTVTNLLTSKPGTSDEVFKQPNAMRQKLLDKKLLTMIIMDLQPMSFVDSKYFADVMKLADPRYSLPSKTTITSELLPKLYKETATRVLNRLEGINHVAITTELWSPRHQENYLGVTAHFICPAKWTLQSFMLSTTTFYGTPTGKHIACELERTIAEWNITDKVRVMITDNETNARLANEQLPWAYIPCLAHLINIVVVDAISADADTTALIEKVCDIVRHFKGDDDSKQKLAEVQRSLNLPKHTLVFDCVPSSRWNSIYFMLERALEQTDAINAVMVASEKEEMCLTSHDRDILGLVIAALKPFEIATKTIKKSTTISTAMPMVKGLMKMMSTCSAAGGKKPLVTALKEGLAESFGKIEDIDWIVAATVLDPRFKKCPYIEKEVITKAKEIITAEVSSICQQEEKESVNASKPEEDSLWMYLDVMMNSAHQEQKEEIPSAATEELRRYLDSPPVSRDDNPLLYWQQHQELFPTLCQVALKYMTVPITSVPGERCFTEAGEVLVEKRSKLTAENINMMLFLNNNLPHFGQA